MADKAELKIVSRDQEIHEDIVGTLEGALAGAKEGEFCGVAMVCFRPDGSCCVWYSRMVDMPRKLGALEMLKVEILNGSRE